jgi:YHS domain-containing protein
MRIIALTLAVLSLSSLGLAFQESPAKASMTLKSGPTDAEVVAEQLPSYPLTTCPISQEPLDAMGAPKDVVFEGRLVRLCCKSCKKSFKKDPAATLAKIDKAVIQAQLASYPLSTCPVSGEALGSMDEVINVVHGTRLVRLCCKGCKKGFAKAPAKHMAMIDAALIEAQKASYPLTTCLVSGKTIEGDGFNMLHGTQLTRFCCGDCAAKFKKEPTKYVAKLNSAKMKK